METFKITEDMSPYKFSKKLGVRPQMIYNYIGSGRIKGVKNNLGHWVITKEVGTQFGQKYLERKELRKELGYK